MLIDKGEDKGEGSMCKGCNGDKLHYESFDELPQEFIEKFKCAKTSRFASVKKSYVDFVNKLNENGDKLIGDYTGNEKQTLIRFNKCGHIPPKGINPYWYKKGVGCPVCKGFQVQRGVNDLATTHPKLAKEWHPTKNTKTPYNITYGHGEKVWWLGKCGHEWDSMIVSRVDGCGCPYCANKKVLKGYNDIATTHPHFIPFFANIEDTYKYTYCSDKKIDTVCPHCGKIKDIKMSIANLIRQGFSCPYCGDGYSYPEKLMVLVLKALGIEFTRQLTHDNGKHKYDFYVALWKAIFETHGIQHYKGWNNSEEDLIRQQNNDSYKRYLALQNSILNENYHEIDCRKSTLEWCRPNIEKALSKYVDVSILTDEDWVEFDKQAQKSLMINICKCWREEKEINKNLSATDLGKEFGINRNTVAKYLKWGNESGLCEYNSDEERQAKNKRLSTFVYLVKPNGEKWFDKSMSQSELARQSGISVSTIKTHRQNGNSLECKQNSKYDPKYIGSYVVYAHEYDTQNN